MTFQLALVTGASSGIGKAICRLLAKNRIPLLITGRNQEKLTLLAEELKDQVEVEFFTAHLDQSRERSRVIEKIYKQVPNLVINNAGFGLYGQVLTHETKKQMEIFEVDAAAVLEISIEAARALISQGKPGVVLNVSSAAAFQTFPSFAVYSASKAFVNSFSQSFDEETKQYGVRILAACPGMVDTGFRERASEGAETKKYLFSMTPEIAAEEIWKQINAKKPLHIFDWRYRLVSFLKNLLPKRFVINQVRRIIDSRYASRKIIKKK
jgi:short-subunit dehydrogenase